LFRARARRYAPSAAGSLGDPESIDVLGTTGGVERITLDLTGGVFGPGFTVEGNVPEIEIAMALGSGADRVVVIGTNRNDSIAMGLNGLSLNAGGGVDVTFSVLPAALEIQGLDGVDFLTGRDGFGARLACAGSLTLRAGNLGDVADPAPVAVETHLPR
jgi:hypothetical protein